MDPNIQKTWLWSVFTHSKCVFTIRAHSKIWNEAVVFPADLISKEHLFVTSGREKKKDHGSVFPSRLFKIFLHSRVIIETRCLTAASRDRAFLSETNYKHIFFSFQPFIFPSSVKQMLFTKIENMINTQSECTNQFVLLLLQMLTVLIKHSNWICFPSI